MTPASLEVTGLSCRRGGRPVFEDLSFAVTGGELLALTGRNGSGKTTLLRALALLLTTGTGQIRWRGEDVAGDREAWRRQIAWLGHLDGLKGDLSVRENLAVAAKLRDESPDRIDQALASFDLEALARRDVRTLSAGQRRRAALARVASTHAPLWLLDEPLNALDAPSQAALRAMLGRHLAAGGLAIAATHAPIDVAGARVLELGR
jgi:heme exporter protein A